jgi:hypothetical protein
MLYKDSYVLLSDGTTRKQIKDIVYGDSVSTDDGPATVVGIVKQLDDHHGMQTSDGLCMSMWQPVAVPTGWMFAFETLNSFVPADGDYKYDLLLESGKSHFWASGGADTQLYKCTSLAHGLTGSICAHPFFGTDLCRTELLLYLDPITRVVQLAIRPWLRDLDGMTVGIDPLCVIP